MHGRFLVGIELWFMEIFVKDIKYFLDVGNNDYRNSTKGGVGDERNLIKPLKDKTPSAIQIPTYQFLCLIRQWIFHRGKADFLYDT